MRHSSEKTAKQLPAFLILLFVLLPLLIIAVYTSLQTFRDLHQFTLSRRQTIAFLTAATTQERLEKIIDVGTSLATRVQFQKLIESGKWDEAVKIMESVPKHFPYIERVALFDPNGIVMAVTPLTSEIAAVIGKDFSYRDYYQGVSKNWEPYVAEAIQPAVPLGYNLVPVAIPIQSESGKILGILLLNLKLDTITAWSKTIEVGPAGFVYIVDQKGHLIAHPTLLPAAEIVDFSSVPAVQKALREERGVEILFNPIENEQRLSAYEPVPRYGWGVVVVQPTRTAFIERNETTIRMVAIWVLVIFAAGFFTYRLLRDKNIIAAQRDKERILLKSIGDGVVAIDRQWNIILWNPAATLISGYTEQEALGKPLRDILKFMRMSDRKENIVFIEDAIVRGETRQLENETVLIRKDGSEIPVGDSASPIFDQGGRIMGAIIIFRDVSQERERQALRSDFAYASHQLRTPVNQALWTIETAQGAKGIEEMREAMRIAYLSVRSVQKLVSQLLEVSEIDQGTISQKKETIKVTDVFEGVIKDITIETKARNVTLSIEPISAVAGIETDPKMLKRILTEVLENAVYYNTANGKVHVKVTIQQNDVFTEISDTGIGIPESQKALVFTKFFRGSNIPPEMVGAGLGLYIAKNYVQLLGGKIWFKSEEKKGTTFSILLPIT